MKKKWQNASIAIVTNHIVAMIMVMGQIPFSTKEKKRMGETIQKWEGAGALIFVEG